MLTRIPARWHLYISLFILGTGSSLMGIGWSRGLRDSADTLEGIDFVITLITGFATVAGGLLGHLSDRAKRNQICPAPAARAPAKMPGPTK